MNTVFKADSIDSILRPCHINKYTSVSFLLFHVCMVHNVFNHFPINGQFGCSKLFMLVTHTMMNIFVNELWCTYQIICAGSLNSWGSA